MTPLRSFPSPHFLPGSEAGRLMIEAQPSPIAQRIRRASDGSFGARPAARSEVPRAGARLQPQPQ